MSANAELLAAVVGRVADDERAPDPVTLARIERGRDAATARYRRDRDPDALEATMRALDQEERQAKATFEIVVQAGPPMLHDDGLIVRRGSGRRCTECWKPEPRPAKSKRGNCRGQITWYGEE